MTNYEQAMKYRYYFRKPRTEIVKDIFKCLAVAGVIIVAGSSPRFVRLLGKKIKKALNKKEEYSGRSLPSAFYRLCKAGSIQIKRRNNQIYISLTEKGKKKAGWMQIDELNISRPKKWDKKWRLVIFDIAQLKKTFREAFRGKLKEIGFCQLQKSVWAHPFECKDEINLLKDFFGLSDNELRLIVAENIGECRRIKRFFNLSI